MGTSIQSASLHALFGPVLCMLLWPQSCISRKLFLPCQPIDITCCRLRSWLDWLQGRPRQADDLNIPLAAEPHLADQPESRHEEDRARPAPPRPAAAEDEPPSTPSNFPGLHFQVDLPDIPLLPCVLINLLDIFLLPCVQVDLWPRRSAPLPACQTATPHQQLLGNRQAVHSQNFP